MNTSATDVTDGIEVLTGTNTNRASHILEAGLLATGTTYTVTATIVALQAGTVAIRFATNSALTSYGHAVQSFTFTAAGSVSVDFTVTGNATPHIGLITTGSVAGDRYQLIDGEIRV